MGESSNQGKKKFNDMQDLEKLPTEELRKRMFELELEVAKRQGELQKMKMRKNQLNWAIEENHFIMRGINRPPWVVATVNQKWLEEDEAEANKKKKEEEAAKKDNESQMEEDEDEEDEEMDEDDDEGKNRMHAIVKTSTRRVMYLKNTGLVDEETLHPGDEVCVNRETCVIVRSVPQDYDPKVKAMEVVEKPSDRYSDIGGLELQIRELMEAIVLPIKYKERFEKLQIAAPKGVLLYGPPGTGKTLLARACAAETEATFMKLSATILVQHFIGEGSRLVREAFKMARAKAPTILFIDEIDAIGGKRFGSEKSGDREVQRTMMELLNQLDGFSSNDDVKVIAATNRVDALDPALLRSGRLDKKIEIPEPDEQGRVQVFQIHTRTMKLDGEVNLAELAKMTDGFNAASCRAVCVEAAMTAMRRDATSVTHQDFMDGITEVSAVRRRSETIAYA